MFFTISEDQCLNPFKIVVVLFLGLMILSNAPVMTENRRSRIWLRPFFQTILHIAVCDVEKHPHQRNRVFHKRILAPIRTGIVEVRTILAERMSAGQNLERTSVLLKIMVGSHGLNPAGG